MKIELSAALERVLQSARAHAQRHGKDQVGPDDLLHGLIEDEEGQPLQLLQAAGMDRSALRIHFPPLAAAEGTSSSEKIPLAEQSREILAAARDLARLHAAEGTVGSDHVLLALLEIDEPLRARLEGMGLDFAALKDRITPRERPLALDEPLDFTPPTEAMDTARILDACANRAREGLRVLEDYCRFVLGDAFLSGQLKNLRHELAEALAALPANLLLAARSTLGDVGTTLTTPREQERASLLEVAQANAKRLEEALRSLEEFGKIVSPTFGQSIEQLRYQSYTLEQAIVLGSDARARLADARLYVLVTEELCRHSLAGTVREALDGGAQVIQLREKKVDDRKLLDKARDIRRLTRSAGAIFIVNDRPDIALLADADGVHLGQEDLPIHEARRVLGPDALIGVSTHNLEQARRAIQEGASYLGVGPTFPSGTKEFSEFPGLEFVREVMVETSLPAFVLGGVTLDNLKEVIAAGGRRVAVSGAICAADDPRGAAAKMRAMLT